MELKKAFGIALRRLRQSKGLSQEDFSEVSSRTYLSTLERGLKGPTIEKVQELASTLGVHPMTVLASCYLQQNEDLSLEDLFDQIRAELSVLGASR
jgi:transcriptional regulator with XRE-family HTH domain